ncbi:hypothetical protein [Nonomuraea sediminis]|uniref:hypothetical protein n=1 Tax=Nonomuraea sediminis TaxID=2835864 RepID=UPI001BDCC0BB|nr:hypothetical protein [Nonomuraea sediminis]
MNRVVGTLTALGAAVTLGTVTAPAGATTIAPAHTAVAEQASSASACRMVANIWRRSNHSYQIGAGAVGCARGLYAIKCRPLHRHGYPFPRWHEHGIYSKSQDNAILFLTPHIRGTNGDHYKAKCWFYRDNRLLATRTTYTIEL